MTSVFISNLDFAADENSISDFVSSVARVESTTVARYQNGDSKGFAIVVLSSEQDAINAINQLNGASFMDRELIVREDRGPTTSKRNQNQSDGEFVGGGQLNPSSLHVSNLSWGTEDEGLLALFQNFGPNSAEVMVHEDSGRKKGWGLVHFETAEDAQDAMQQLQGAELDGRPVRIKVDGGQSFAAPRQRQPRKRQPRREREPRPERKENCSGLNVFLGNLSWGVDDDMLAGLVGDYGSLKAEVIYGEGGRSRGYAIVSFNNPQDAERAVQGLNGYEFEGRAIQARLDKFS